jgi:hypothetical protein
MIARDPHRRPADPATAALMGQAWLALRDTLRAECAGDPAALAGFVLATVDTAIFGPEGREVAAELRGRGAPELEPGTFAMVQTLADTRAMLARVYPAAARVLGPLPRGASHWTVAITRRGVELGPAFPVDLSPGGVA